MHDPNDWMRLARLAGELIATGKRPLDALAVARAAVECDPNQAAAWNTLGAAYHSIPDSAVEQTAAAREAVRLSPDDETAWHNLSLGLMKRFDFEAALDAAAKAVSFGTANAFLPLQAALLAQLRGRYGVALEYLKRAEHRLEAKHPRRRELLFELWVTRAALCAALDDWDGFHDALAHRHEFSDPDGLLHNLWKWERLWGEDQAPSSDRGQALVYLEWGIGDQIQFARLVPGILKKVFGFSRVTVACSAPLVRIMRSLSGADEVIDHYGLGAEDIRSDVAVIPVIDLMRVASKFGLFPLGAWEGPYLESRFFHYASDGSDWQPRREPSKRAIAFCWQGDPLQSTDFNRRIPFQAWCEFARLNHDRYTFHSVQSKFSGHGEPWAGWPAGVPVEDCSPMIADIADTAAIISKCDVFVGQCGSSLHLAGALGKPAVAMLGFAHDFRWDTSEALYGNFVQVEQRTAGDWRSAFDQLPGAIDTVLDRQQAESSKEK
jgi:tetratricopeptide (TPR) repeat protein